MSHKCIACNKKRITYRFAICTECEKIYGNRARDWPDWLRFLWNDIQRQRRRERNEDTHEIPLTSIESEESYVNEYE